MMKDDQGVTSSIDVGVKTMVICLLSWANNHPLPLIFNLIHQVPRQTLQDRVSGRVVHGSRSGGPTMLSPEDENSLVQYCLYCVPRGFPLTHRVLVAFATALRWKRHPGGNIPKLGKT
ncbi:hypothetical protein SKAU_G00210980 [Synaphobranchus kaupii]|uniref:Uncharacterized protein n=1 Tax=Synaphobranchus kaupii TaxID=118154 RepID=A0A9Q1F8U9_SYNKA|nr:hypothetical protein SKAU_G00210980 [Synaphobranchus kaupii]